MTRIEEKTRSRLINARLYHDIAKAAMVNAVTHHQMVKAMNDRAYWGEQVQRLEHYIEERF